jgi:hypothetical protein
MFEATGVPQALKNKTKPVTGLAALAMKAMRGQPSATLMG